MTDAEIVVAAAKGVMGWKDIRQMEYDASICAGGPWWNPLTSEADCWQLVDKLADGTREFALERGYMEDFHGYAWYANFDDATGVAWHPDRRRAIVLAALQACGATKGAR